MEREDTQPWYKQFWPWFLILLPGSTVVAGLFTLWLAMQTSDSLVTQSDVGINVLTELHLAAEREATRLGLAASINIDVETGAIFVTLTSKTNAAIPALLNLQLIHPTLVAQDLTIDLVKAMPDANGDPAWAGHLVTPPEGRRYIILSSGDTWRLSGEWTGQKVVQLGPRGQAPDGGR
jgi:hypothetical protein